MECSLNIYISEIEEFLLPFVFICFRIVGYVFTKMNYKPYIPPLNHVKCKLQSGLLCFIELLIYYPIFLAMLRNGNDVLSMKV